MPSTAAKYFANYTQIPGHLPSPAWMALRLLTLIATLCLAGALILTPFGLTLFWGLAIPLLPALFVIAPGLWRQVCPMALMNQLPLLAGHSFHRDLPGFARHWAFTIAAGAFIAIIAMRAPLLNHNGPLVGFGVIGMLLLALAGGIVFKGRSGWCGTFCPLAPIQRDYGHAPLLLVRNGYCRPCVGCQKNCYDFNPRAAVFEDLYDSDPAYAGQRRFFMAMMPGMVLGYFLPIAPVPYGGLARAAVLLGFICLSVGLYQAAISFFRINPFRAANLFACSALAAFYWFAGPLILSAGQALSGLAFPSAIVRTSQLTGLVLAAALSYRGWKNERLFRKVTEESTHLHVDQTARTLRDRVAAASVAMATDAETGTAFPVAPNQTLLEAMEAAHIGIDFGCRSGLCGADAVLVKSGSDNLSPPGPDELATLQRLGLDGLGRLACVCRVKGDVVVDRDVENAKRAYALTPPSPGTGDPLVAKGISKVVIVGNGVAGVTVAENLRRQSELVEITIVTDEPHHFYNRMAVGRVLYGRSAMDGLMLLPETWYADHKIEVWRNTLAESIDRQGRELRLGTREALPYDILVLATGADPLPPAPEYRRFSNCFVLRSAADALAVRMWAQRNAAHKAVVIGGGILGIEAADALRLLGMKVVLLQRADRLMDRQLDEQGAKRLTRYLGNIDIDVRTGVSVVRFEGDSLLQAVVLNDGSRVAADMFVACIGIAPRVELARSCGLEVGRGIKVDAFMCTSDPAIYAVGDAAELPGALAGFWPVAVAQASACIAGMLGRPDGYQPPHTFAQLKCDGIDLRSFGEVDVRPDDEIISAQEDAPAWWRFVLRDGKLTGAILVGPPGTGRDFGRLLNAETDLSPVLNELRQGRIEALVKL